MDMFASDSGKRKQKPRTKSQRYFSIGTLVGIVVMGIVLFSIPKIMPPPGLQAHNMVVADHSHVKIESVNGLALPAGIGINAELWKGHEFDDLGINGLAPMHTHAADGYIHIETTKRTTFTLKDFLDVWGVQYNAVKLETVYETNVFGETNYGTIPNPLNYPLGDGQHLRLTLL